MTEDKAKKPFVFVLMPFKKAFDDIYKLGIKAACEEAGCECERVDEQKFTKFILDQVYEQIAKADFLVAELSEPNINVYYEVGYAHSFQGKIVILVAQKEEQIPFDLKYYPFIIYDGVIHQLKEQLIDKAKWAVVESKKKPAKVGPPQSENIVDEIKRLQDEIDYIRLFGGKETIARKLGNIRRLIELGVKPLPLEKCDLNEAELPGFDLQRANLRGANLRGTNLRKANLWRADLRDSDLWAADISGAFGITFEQLLEVKSLYKVKGLDPELEARLKKEKPELFEEFLKEIIKEVLSKEAARIIEEEIKVLRQKGNKAERRH